MADFVEEKNKKIMKNHCVIEIMCYNESNEKKLIEKGEKSMRVIVAMDSFKGSLSSSEAGNAVREGILKACPTAEVETAALADGGEGTAETLVCSMGGFWETCEVHDPLGRPREARYGVIPERNLAIIESAQAIGLVLLTENERNPMKASSVGLGEMIAHAIEKGYRNFLIGIGGSATNDGGVGMLSALGYEFLNENGDPIGSGAGALRYLSEIRTEGRNPALSECHFSVACDVKNPIGGTYGCSRIFAPQKGASPKDIPLMDAYLVRYAVMSGRLLQNNFATKEGGGAAGGLGFAFVSYLNAELCKGASLVMELTKLEEKIKKADILVTGEGSFDHQSYMGKGPFEAAQLAKLYGKQVIVLAGSVSNTDSIGESGITAAFSIVPSPCSLAQAMEEETARHNLKQTAEQIFRLIGAMWGK